MYTLICSKAKHFSPKMFPYVRITAPHWHFVRRYWQTCAVTNMAPRQGSQWAIGWQAARSTVASRSFVLKSNDVHVPFRVFRLNFSWKIRAKECTECQNNGGFRGNVDVFVREDDGAWDVSKCLVNSILYPLRQQYAACIWSVVLCVGHLVHVYVYVYVYRRSIFVNINRYLFRRWNDICFLFKYTYKRFMLKFRTACSITLSFISCLHYLAYVV